MPTIDEMEELVNWEEWDMAPSTTGQAGKPEDTFGFDMSAQDINNDPNHVMDLSLENVVDDDFGFFALQHFSGDLPGPVPNGSESPPVDMSVLRGPDLDGAFAVDNSWGSTLWPRECWEIPPNPCERCALGGFLCKLMQEGKYKGYCTSCVALGNDCSFAPALAAVMSSLPDVAAPQPSTSWNSQPEFSSNLATENPLNLMMHSSSATDLPSMTTSAPPVLPNPAAVRKATPGSGSGLGVVSGPAKIGARLSRETIRVLRQWLSTHSRHPYPSDEEKEMLQRQTGLTKTQITNWLANARRRGKVQAPRSTSPHVQNLSACPGGATVGMDIPRRGTPAIEAMNPLQRWANSPPEHEPASAIAIARAVTESTVSSGQASPFSHVYTDDGTGRSLQGSSASSNCTSHGTTHSSNKSFASAYSHASRGSLGSFGSFGSLGRSRRRRRRRNVPQKAAEEKSTPLAAPLKTYQCTFCTETFKTKHDWQRHEKSLHLSLERWVCCTHGPRAAKSDPSNGSGLLSCVFCGEANPSDNHIESHNYSSCQDKNLEGRTFYRKDHLNQHLRLVHNVKFADWSMKSWRVASPEIRSRCGFCGIVMDTWSIRVDHLAEHFKTGCSMADWKGDWGFDAPVLELVENSIPPYLIHTERQSPLPFIAGVGSPESPRNAYELIKLELDYFLDKARELSIIVDEQIQLEACRIIFASEVLSLLGISSTVSWLRDLIMSNESVVQQGKVAPLRSQAENRLSLLKINGKDNLFEACPLEAELREFVRARTLLGLTAMDDELQEEACKIVGRMEEVSTHPSDAVANWLVRHINASTAWLAPFRQRAHLPRSEDMADHKLRPKDLKNIDSTVHNYSRLERELGEYLDLQHALGVEPTDDDLRRQARIIIYELEDGWNQTAADNDDWLAAFRRRHSQSSQSDMSPLVLGSGGTSSSLPQSSSASGRKCSRGPRFSLNDANCYRRLAMELTRYVASTTSANNPNQHVPSDEELQHQARWILYDDDDPWNQTAADNAEWLQRFKRDVGILKQGPGLPAGDSWSVQQGGSGFAPPYAFPREGGSVPVLSCRDGARAFETTPVVANKYIESLATRYRKPGRIFCSRELEEGLSAFVVRCLGGGRGGGGANPAAAADLPSDEELRGHARAILGTETTAADDAVLLAKFKNMMQEQMNASAAAPVSGGAGTPILAPAASGIATAVRDTTLVAPIPVSLSQLASTSAMMDTAMNMADITEDDMNKIMDDMNFEFDPAVGLNTSTF